MIAAPSFEAVCRTPWGGPWRRFRNPSHVIAATSASAVRAALEEVDERVRQGSYAAGFVTYEAAAAFGSAVHSHDPGLPLVCFGIFAPNDVDAVEHLPQPSGYQLSPWTASVDHDAYLDAIRSIKHRIEKGDTYQIDFTFRLRSRFAGDPLGLMRDLYAAQAGAFSAYVDVGTHAICSASPELFFRLDRGHLECRPMKGTAPRGLWTARDELLGAALRESQKNRAENVMIVDLVRNDLGRIARIGTVRPSSLFDVERYPMQWQMTSTVEAEARTTSLVAVFAAMFPSGSVTGAPKYSAMSIIRELETTPRGIYTGAIGYASPHGHAQFNVAIRSVMIDRRIGSAEFGVGSGIVWDSVDRDEYDECLLKARIIGPRIGATAPVASAGRRSASYVVREPPGFQLLESLRWTPEDGFSLLERHIARLAGSAACFGFQCDEAQVRQVLSSAVADLRQPAKLRVMLEVDGSFLCEAVDLVPIRQPVHLAVAAHPVDSSDVFLYHKTTNRGLYDRARAAHPQADSVILWNDAGEATECLESNLVVLLDGERVTPPVDCGLLPGTMRAELLERGEISERRIPLDALRRAEKIWLVNSVRGWMEGQLMPKL